MSGTGDNGCNSAPIEDTITSTDNSITYEYHADGGDGGQGGKGGTGGEGGWGADGGRGGYGVCGNNGVIGNGGDGGASGKGGKGGQGGVGGTGGLPGNGNNILIHTQLNNNPHINHTQNGGHGGPGGEPGDGGPPGVSGSPGYGGDSGSATGACFNSTFGHSGNRGSDPGNDGFGDPGTRGTSRESQTGTGGSYELRHDAEGDPCFDPPCDGSPIVFDIGGDGIHLSNMQNGVPFDLNSNGFRETIPWTTADTDDAWLVLDRNGNGTVDNGSEMFGNFTPQASPPLGEEPNGFLALAELDSITNGGNNDGQISSADFAYAELRLWQDTNHNGISEPGELHTLPDLDVLSINLDYKDAYYVDEFGNVFRYRAKVRDQHRSRVGRWAWDVFLITSSPMSPG